MNTKTTGIVMVIIGILMMIYTSFSYITTEKIVDLGPMHMSVEKENPVQWSPIVGVVLLVGGIILVVIDRKK